MNVLQEYGPNHPCKFTIIAPFYNRLDYFADWLSSILAQRETSTIELLILDDCSHDFARGDLEKAFQPFRETISQSGLIIRYHRQSANLGENRNTNDGIARANGEWIHILHDDDQLFPDAFSTFSEIIDRNPDLDLISGRFHNMDQNGATMWESPVLAPDGLADRKFREIFLANCPLHPPTTLYRKDFLNRIGRFREDLKGVLDWELWRRISQLVGSKWYYTGRLICKYRFHDNQISQHLRRNPAGEHLWRLISIGQEYYTPDEVIRAKALQYVRLFRMIDRLLAKGDVAGSIGILTDLARFSGLADGVWQVALDQLAPRSGNQIAATLQTLAAKFDPTAGSSAKNLSAQNQGGRHEPRSGHP